ncbi:LysR family transcriptional regulator [Variovorax sp. PBS-H4]|uniref:LysR family transcriptional regulator n=1 Tax=Variovorax sp. PBS-H4 TaxID=434008 RepID=UPI0013A5958D|nr:LysR family transcriptional regulator [Variovorax sp. PBS-H4]
MPAPNIDLHLLRCLETLVAERHVTRAADKLGMSQSGMSTALAKLRTIFDDPILVRTPHGMQPSEHAPAIAGSVRRALNEIDLAIARRGAFDPETSSMGFTIMASDYVGYTLMPPLVDRVRQVAPNVSLTVAIPEPSRIREALANSEVDLVVGFYHDISEGLYQTIVTHDRLACVVRAGHPRISGSVSAEQYSAEDHIYYGAPPNFVSSVEVLLERVLPPLGLERRVVLHMPSLAMMPRVVSRTDLVATMPFRLAHSVADAPALQVLPLPFELPEPELPVRAIWHERMHDNNAHRWLRGLVQDIGRSL